MPFRFSGIIKQEHKHHNPRRFGVSKKHREDLCLWRILAWPSKTAHLHSSMSSAQSSTYCWTYKHAIWMMWHGSHIAIFLAFWLQFIMCEACSVAHTSVKSLERNSSKFCSNECLQVSTFQQPQERILHVCLSLPSIMLFNFQSLYFWKDCCIILCNNIDEKYGDTSYVKL